jgi:hypothetical protein
MVHFVQTYKEFPELGKLVGYDIEPGPWRIRFSHIEQGGRKRLGLWMECTWPSWFFSREGSPQLEGTAKRWYRPGFEWVRSWLQHLEMRR